MQEKPFTTGEVIGWKMVFFKKWYYRKKKLVRQSISSVVIWDNLDTEENLEATVSIRSKEIAE